MMAQVGGFNNLQLVTTTYSLNFQLGMSLLTFNCLRERDFFLLYSSQVKDIAAMALPKTFPSLSANSFHHQL